MGWGGLDSAEVTNNLKTSRINSIKVSRASVTVPGEGESGLPTEEELNNNFKSQKTNSNWAVREVTS